jgi:hypothetical protein
MWAGQILHRDSKGRKCFPEGNDETLLSDEAEKVEHLQLAMMLKTFSRKLLLEILKDYWRRKKVVVKEDRRRKMRRRRMRVESMK